MVSQSYTYLITCLQLKRQRLTLLSAQHFAVYFCEILGVYLAILYQDNLFIHESFNDKTFQTYC